MSWQDIILETTISQKVDDLKTAFVKVKNNLDYLKTNTMVGFNNIGSGEHIVDSIANSTMIARTIGSGSNIAVTVDNGTIKISAINTGLSFDTTPTLSNNLDTHGFAIYNSVNGQVKINDIVISDLNGDALLSTDTNLNIKSLDAVNGKIILGSPVIATNVSAIGFYGPTNGLHTGNVIGDVSGNLSGVSTGVHNGSVIGNVSGTVSDISNHSINELKDVSKSTPLVGDIFMWDGTKYSPVHAHSIIPKMSTADRDLLTAINGSMIYNTTVNKFQGLANGLWVDIT